MECYGLIAIVVMGLVAYVWRQLFTCKDCGPKTKFYRYNERDSTCRQCRTDHLGY